MKPADLLERLQCGAPLPDSITVAAADAARAWLEAEAPSLAELESLPPELALALVEAQARARHAERLVELSHSTAKPIAKAAKAALYRLKSEGVAVPMSGRGVAAPAAPALAAPADDRSLPALLSPLTTDAEQGLLVVRPLRGGGLETLHFVLDDVRGITDLRAGEVNRATYRKQLREPRGSPPAFVEVSLARAKARLAEAATVAERAAQPPPEGVAEALRHLGVSPLAELPPLPPPVEDDARRTAQGRALHQEPELASWLPPESELKLFVQKLDVAAAGVLQLSQQQMADRLVQQARAQAHVYFQGDAARRYARRLWAMAEYFDLTDRAESAQLARAEARRMHQSLTGDSPFAEALFEKALALLDGGAPPAPKSAEGRRSPSGLILP